MSPWGDRKAGPDILRTPRPLGEHLRRVKLDTIRFAEVVYVLHAFQKKSRHGIATPRADIELIEQRLKRAREDYEQWSRSKNPTSR
jgi:phage-related protein